MLDEEQNKLLAIRDEKATAIRITLSLSVRFHCEANAVCIGMPPCDASLA